MTKESGGADSKKILVPGCGNSTLSEKMFSELDQKQIISIDFEEETINKMQAKMEAAGQEYGAYLKMDLMDIQN